MVAWERQKGESSKSYAWFKEYRNLGAKRTFEKTIKKIQNDINCNDSENIIPTPTLGNLTNQSSRWHWKKRCRAWDNYQDQLESQANDEAYNETKEKLIGIGNKIMRATENSLEDLSYDDESRPTSKAHAVKSIADSFEKTTKTIRLLYGKSTEIKDSKVEADIGAEVDTKSHSEVSQEIIMNPKYAKLSTELLQDVANEQKQKRSAKSSK
ncbi:hypothetical protein [Methanobrevibacter sp. UBA337]|jgi:hypothetical protein|uniref:hypothetical protein n=1 Tax=Methanobrevibacter sp. UBA337 TaxID=1915480 RepID=UPI0039B95E26